MSPMSLLTSPVSSLQEAAQHPNATSPRGERNERRIALLVAILSLACAAWVCAAV